MKNSIYRKPFSILATITLWIMVAQIIGYVAFGVSTATLMVATALVIIQLPLTIYFVGKAWPGLPDGWNPSRFWAGLLTTTYMGWIKTGLRAIPWDIIVVWGAAMVALQVVLNWSTTLTAESSPSITLLAIGTGVGAIIYPVVSLMSYGVGRGIKILVEKMRK